MITIEDLKKKQSETSRLIGLDLGSKRIGVSICDEKQSIATPFKTINKTNTKELINELKKLASLPTYEEAIAKLLSVMQGPIKKLMGTMQAVPGKLVRTIDAVKTTKN